MGPSIHVLLVEDNAADVLLLREALARASEFSFTVRHVELLSEALATLAHCATGVTGRPRPPAGTGAAVPTAGREGLEVVDVVLLDLGLPDSEGLETFLQMQQQAPGVPVVVLTGLADETLGMRAMQTGAQDYLVKGQVEGPILARALRYALERRRAEETVREYAEHLALLSRRLLDAQESERRRLARELHDEIGQVLTAVKINVQALKKHVSPAGLPRLEESIEVVTRAIQQVRDMSLDLRPSVLDDLGLAAALRWYADRQAQRGSFAVHVATDGLPVRLPAELETVCFRVAQEALTNVLRHGQARHVQITLRLAAGNLCLRVRDDGVGFDLVAAQARAAAGRSLGLLGMRERVHLAGGKLEIVSRPGQGTEVRAWLPFAQAPLARAL